MPIGRHAGAIGKVANGQIAKVQADVVNPCGSDPALEFTVTGISSGNRDGTDGDGDYINWIGKKWYNSEPQVVCPASYQSNLCYNTTTGTVVSYIPARERWFVNGAGGTFDLWAQTGGIVTCPGTFCLNVYVPIAGRARHTGVAAFTYNREYILAKNTCAPSPYSVPGGFPGGFISNNIASVATLYWPFSPTIVRPVSGSVTSTQGISISWQEYAGW